MRWSGTAYKRFDWQSQVNYVWDGLLVHMLANAEPGIHSADRVFHRVPADSVQRSCPGPTDLDPEVVTLLQGIIILLVASERVPVII